jgi:UDP-GlcNAc3NAcA epimerase
VLENIMRGTRGSGCAVIFPVHPRTRKALENGHIDCGRNVRLIEPVGYLEMLVLEDAAEAIVTDSGGVQKEAYFAGRPAVTLRETTEWTETVAAGWNTLVGTDPRAIAAAMQTFRPRGPRPELFGDGHAAARIVERMTGNNMGAHWTR